MGWQDSPLAGDPRGAAREIERQRGTGVPFAPRWQLSPIADLHSGDVTASYAPPRPDMEAIVAHRGAPAGVRYQVGGAKTEDDRLATLRLYYPDAEPYNVKGQNYVFTDPETKRPTLYNPRSLDAGDFASVIPEAIEMGGAAAGGFVGGPWGAGAGATIAREAEQDINVAMGNRVDTRRLAERIADPLVAFGVNAGGYKLGEMIAGPVGSAAAPSANAVARGRAALPSRIDDFRSVGVPNPPLGALSDSRAAGMLENMVSGTPGGADVLGTAYNTANTALGNTAARIATSFGGGRLATAEQAGRTLQGGLRAAGERYERTASRLYDQAYEKIDNAARQQVRGADLPEMRAVLADLEEGMRLAPRSMGESVGPALTRVRNAIGDVGDGNVDFRILRQMRTDLGQDLNNPILMGASGSAEPHLRRLYAAMTEDMNRIARARGAGAELTRADNFYRAAKARTESVQAIADAATPEQALRLALAGSSGPGGGGSMLVKLRRTVRPEEWNDVSGNVLGRMGLANPGQQAGAELGEQGAFSAATFITNWSKMSNDAKNALFRGTQYEPLVPALNQLVRVAGRLKEAQRLAYPAGAQRAGYQMQASAAMGAAGAFATGDVLTGAGIAALSYLGPRVASKLMTNPTFVRRFAAAIHATGDYAGRPTLRMAAQMAAVTQAEPALTEDVAAFLDALRTAESSGQPAARPLYLRSGAKPEPQPATPAGQ